MLMNDHENDPLRGVLHEWKAPEPSPALDARVLEGWRASRRPPFWRRVWSFRVSIPVPVLGALLLVIAAAWWLGRRAEPPIARPTTAAPSSGGYLTRLDASGFQPLPDGEVRIIRSGEKKQ
jgi:hypothetical protein